MSKDPEFQRQDDLCASIYWKLEHGDSKGAVKLLRDEIARAIRDYEMERLKLESEHAQSE